MASARASIAELLDSGLTLTVGEAVAIARAALACDATSVAGAELAPERPLPDAIFVEDGGRIVCEGAAPSIPNVALLLRSLLPAGSPGVPGGLRYAIARALREVDAPPFELPEDFSTVLARFEPADGAGASTLARVAGGDRLTTPARGERRRPNGATISVLRRALREADSQLYEQRRSADAPVATRPSRARRVLAIAAGLSAAVVLFAAGAVTRDRLATPSLPRTEAARAAPVAGDIVLEPRARKSSVRNEGRAAQPKPQATRRAPAKDTKNKGFFARLHLQWLKKAFS